MRTFNDIVTIRPLCNDSKLLSVHKRCVFLYATSEKKVNVEVIGTFE